MALKLKNPTLSNKGIIILTHKEQHLLRYFSPYRQRYLMGCHIGCWAKKKSFSGFDFYLSSLNQLAPSFSEKDKVIELNSRNFLPDEYGSHTSKSKDLLLSSIKEMHKFSKTKISDELLDSIQNTNQDKIWDILWVAKPHEVKKIQSFLDNIKKLFNYDKPYQVLLICAIAPNETIYPQDHLDVENYINSTFTPEEKKYITLFRPYSGGNEGLDNKFLPPFYHWSKNLAFYSSAEGESRVVHEALCAGLPIIYYKHVEGGSSDYLDESNSFSFENYEDSYLTLLEAVNTSKSFDLELIHKKCLHSNSIKALKHNLSTLYKKHGQIFDGELLNIPNLHFELPAHVHTVPWKSDQHETGDLTAEKFNIFTTYNAL